MSLQDRIRSSTMLTITHLCWLLLLLSGVSQAEVEHKVYCSAKEMRVSIQLPDDKTLVYLDKLKGYPDCKPVIEGNRAVFYLSLEDIYTCGTTRISDFQGHRIFYNKVIVEVTKNKKEKIRVKCGIRSRNLLGLGAPRMTRDVLPEGFYEPDDINITETIIGNGALPDLQVGVRQNGQLIDTQINVNPGTPLQMQIFLDQNSTDTYGLFVNYMNVTDRSPGQNEILIYKGCSTDPYLFNNFELQDDNSVAAKFRAFKFPESSYVLFIGTVKICVKRCQGIPCSNGQTGFGRRRRSLSSSEDVRDPNQIFEITMTTILKVHENEYITNNKGSLSGIAKNSEPTRIIPAVENTDDIDSNEINNSVYENKGQSMLPPTMFPILLLFVVAVMKHL